jgi:hypothetical protein
MLLSGKLGCNNQLPDVALGVLGQMNYQSNDGSWQSFSSDASCLRKASWVQGTNHSLGRGEGLIYIVEQLASSGSRLRFASHCRKLFGSELIAAQVSSKTLDTARDVAELKSYGRQVMRP